MTPGSLVTKEHVTAALKADKGNGVQLISWNLEEFTKKGDNAASYVTSVKVTFSAAGKEAEGTCYIVKINPSSSYEGLGSEMTRFLFLKEIGFYCEIAPELNALLEIAGEHCLRVPKYLHSCKEENKELIFLEDLRPRGFKMFPRQKGMDMDHAKLVIRELARLHSSSAALQSKHPSVNLDERFEFLKQDISEEGMRGFNGLIQRSVEVTLTLLKSHEGYEKPADWIKKNFASILPNFINSVEKTPFDAVRHGDLWNNNILFRYDERGSPAEVMLLDLQGTTRGPLSLDLNYYLFVSLDGGTRQANLANILELYHNTFKGIMERNGASIPFSLPELQKEFHLKNPVGLLFTMLVIPFVMMEGKDAWEAQEVLGEKTQEESEELKGKALRVMKNSPMVHSRFLSVFEELEKGGHFD